MPTEDNDGKMPTDRGMMYFRNEKTGEWNPLMQAESIECTINLTEEDEAKIAEIIEPLGELDIVPREK